MNEIESALPEHWRGTWRLWSSIIAWLIPFQRDFLGLAWHNDPLCLKKLFFVLPAACVLAGLWVTMLSAYTLPFRSYRLRYLTTIFILWWDSARAIWLFWSGMAKFLFLLAGAVWGLIRLAAATVQELLLSILSLPSQLTGNLARGLLEPGIPWLAVLMTVFWAGLEALIFGYILNPMVTEILTDLVGVQPHAFAVTTLLTAMLFAMILGSFACMHVLVEAIAGKDFKSIAQMAIVELFVMFFEVMFFYRELVDALTPWIAQQTGLQMGIIPVVMFASFGWIGVRGMTWFLFARYGTPTVLAFISRQRILGAEGPAAAPAAADRRWDVVMAKVKAEQSWFEGQANLLLEAAILPAFQIVAATLNFGVALISSKPLFSLPFKSLAEVGETKALLQSMTSLGHLS